MTYVVTDACVRCKYMDCVEVCPVDCFYEGENMLVINPNECIDCGVCEPECPAEAILPDTEDGLEKWLELNLRSEAFTLGTNPPLVLATGGKFERLGLEWNCQVGGGHGCARGRYTDTQCHCACQCESGNPAYLTGSDGPCVDSDDYYYYDDGQDDDWS